MEKEKIDKKKINKGVQKEKNYCACKRVPEKIMLPRKKQKRWQ